MRLACATHRGKFRRELDALDGLENDIDGAEVHQEIRQLCRVKDALARLRSPVYGICSDCEGDIPFTRLLDNPFVTLCRTCEHRRDLAEFVPNEM